MRVHKGIYESNGAPVHWVETATTWEFTLDDLIDGLCSHYIRNRVDGEDEPLPVHLSATALVRTAREEIMRHGTGNTWTWCESSGYDTDEARTWARGLILAVLPDLEV